MGGETHECAAAVCLLADKKMRRVGMLCLPAAMTPFLVAVRVYYYTFKQQQQPGYCAVCSLLIMHLVIIVGYGTQPTAFPPCHVLDAQLSAPRHYMLLVVALPRQPSCIKWGVATGNLRLLLQGGELYAHWLLLLLSETSMFMLLLLLSALTC